MLILGTVQEFPFHATLHPKYHASGHLPAQCSSHITSALSLHPFFFPSPDLTALLTSTYIVCDRSHFQLCTCLQITAHPVPGISAQLLKLLVTSLPHHSPFQLLSLFAIIFCLHQSLTCSLFT